MSGIRTLASRIIASLVLLVSSQGFAGVIVDWEGTGVDFYSSWLDATTLRIEIDAGNPVGGWSRAVSIDSIAINAPDAWSWSAPGDILLSGPGSFGGAVTGSGLSASGCGGLAPGSNHPCWSGLATLADNMYFDFSFADAALISDYTDSPHLKVRFIDAKGGKVGSLLSQDLRSAEVVEPSSLVMLAIGAIGLVCARRYTGNRS